jgi:hypothetical protein
MAVHFRYVKQPLRPEFVYRHIRERVVKELAVVGQAHVIERDQITQDFKHQPHFGYRVETTARQLRLVIYLKNPDQAVNAGWTIADLWEALDEKGTRPHPIPRQPKARGALRFKWGGPGSYRAKTNPGGRFRGPGKVQGGKTVFFKQVHHPGTKPRHFTRRINKDLRRLFLTQAERGYRLGHQQALGLGRR